MARRCLAALCCDVLQRRMGGRPAAMLGLYVLILAVVPKLTPTPLEEMVAIQGLKYTCPEQPECKDKVFRHDEYI